MSQPRTAPAERSWLVPAVVLGVAIVLVAVIVLQQRSTDGAESGASGGASGAEEQGGDAAGEQDAPDLRDLERRDAGDPLAVGPVDAPVGLIVFSDYQCPYCAKWSDDTLPVMMEYVEAGELRIEWRDLNIFGAPSERAARASYAAALQDRYWDYHHALFPDGDTLGESELSEAALVELAEELDLDIDQFTDDLDATETHAEIQGNVQLGQALGINSTPAFLVGGEPVVGAQPTDVFVDAVDTALDAAKE